MKGVQFLLCTTLVLAPLAGCVDDGTDDGNDDGHMMDGSMDHAAMMANAMEIAAMYPNTQAARAAGYEPDQYCVPGMGVHWINMEAFDETLDPAMPEVLLFQPTVNDVDDPASVLLGIEYVVVTQGTDMNTTDAVPSLGGMMFEGPMPGHFPGMPWHAELHLYTADGMMGHGDAGHGMHSGVECPQGTIPGEVEVQAKAAELLADLGTPAKALAAGYAREAACVPGMGSHWVNFGLFDTTLDEDAPEVVLVLPGPGGIYDAGNATVIGVEYVVVTQDTEMNTTETAPRLYNVTFDGPMPGHFPGMPWHAELHVYAGEHARTMPFGHPKESIVCPAGTEAPPTTTADLAAVTPSGVGDIAGAATLTEGPFLGQMTIAVNVSGLTPGEHGVHVHQNGNCDPAAVDGGGPIAAGGAGGHFDPDGVEHGQHAGDLGNILVDADGNGSAIFTANLTLDPAGKYGVLNRSLIVHANADDGTSTANPGARVLCGVIGTA